MIFFLSFLGIFLNYKICLTFNFPISNWLAMHLFTVFWLLYYIFIIETNYTLKQIILTLPFMLFNICYVPLLSLLLLSCVLNPTTSYCYCFTQSVFVYKNPHFPLSVVLHTFLQLLFPSGFISHLPT